MKALIRETLYYYDGPLGFLLEAHNGFDRPWEVRWWFAIATDVDHSEIKYLAKSISIAEMDSYYNLTLKLSDIFARPDTYGYKTFYYSYLQRCRHVAIPADAEIPYGLNSHSFVELTEALPEESSEEFWPLVDHHTVHPLASMPPDSWISNILMTPEKRSIS